MPKYESANRDKYANSQTLYIEIFGHGNGGITAAQYGVRRAVPAILGMPLQFRRQTIIEGRTVLVFDYEKGYTDDYYEWVARAFFAYWRDGKNINSW